MRREPDGIRRYVHISTGNYNAKTARVYTDIGLFTCAHAVGADVSDLFNMLTGFSRQRVYRKLIVAPHGMRQRFLQLVERAGGARDGGTARPHHREDERAGGRGDDRGALYIASQAGVEIDLIVRGICCLRPQVPGLSDRIRVISIIGRFLEHSRIWYFANDSKPEYFIGSADWMPRNFDRRVEIAVPVEDAALHSRLMALLETSLSDNRQAWELAPDGSYTQRMPAGGKEFATHKVLLRESWGQVPRDGAAKPVGAPQVPSEVFG